MQLWCLTELNIKGQNKEKKKKKSLISCVILKIFLDVAVSC